MYIFFSVNQEDNQWNKGRTRSKTPLSSLSSLGLHDQSLFLLIELQTAWNQDEIGLQTEVNLSLFPFSSFFLALSFPLLDT